MKFKQFKMIMNNKQALNIIKHKKKNKCSLMYLLKIILYYNNIFINKMV
jgi:hypothetical protein